MPQKIVFTLEGAPGDAAVYSAAFRDLKHSQGDSLQIKIVTSNNSSRLLFDPATLSDFRNNEPGVLFRPLNIVPWLQAARASTQQACHYIEAAYRDVKKASGLSFSLTRLAPHLPLTREELKPIIAGRYWLVGAGYKTDMTTKAWPTAYWQRLCDLLVKAGYSLVQIGHVKHDHVNPPLSGVTDMVGRTTMRELLRLVYYADGVICHTSFPMHVAAAYDKPCVVLAGGREEPMWEAYDASITKVPPNCDMPVPHRFLHTVGATQCVTDGRLGCWKRRTVPLPRRNHRDDTYNQSLCVLPTTLDEQPVPTCQLLISPEQAFEAVQSYGPPAPTAPLRLQQQPTIATTPDTTPSPITRQATPVCYRLAEPPTQTNTFTAFVLCYGPHHSMHQRCIESIRATVPTEQLELRVAANQCEQKTFDLFARTGVTLVYPDDKERRKYPAMRQMFHDAANPITTPWLLWFDDDSHCRNPAWLDELLKVVSEAAPDIGAVGARFYHPLEPATPQHDGLHWFATAPWWRGQPLCLPNLKPAPNGRAIPFVTGGFWAMRTSAMLEADIPCSRLNHNGGDITIGAQLLQAGYKLAAFNAKKEHVKTSDSPRRGFQERFPWLLTK